MEKELLNTFDKELLLKDLCTRLSYGVKVAFFNEDLTYHSEPKTLTGIECINNLNYSSLEDEDGNTTIVEFVKPYLFPLSSITEKQKRELRQLEAFVNTFGNICFETCDEYGHDIITTYEDAICITDWLNKNHFDFRGLIEKGLALDATGLNIY